MHPALELVIVLLTVLYFLLEAIVLGLIRGLIRLAVGTKRKSVEGKTVLITGAGSGLGRGLAVEFAKLGADLVLWDINEEGNEGTAELVRESGGNVYTYICDVSKREEIYRVAEKVKAEAGQVDILVNNAGIVTGKKFLESPDSLIEKTMDVNINAHFWTCKQFLPGMIERKQGHLVTIASMAGHNGVTGLADYCASKHAAVGFDDAMRLELYGMGLHDIHTTVICPLYINTGMFDGVSAKFPTLLPIFTQEYVVEKIISAVLTNKTTVLLPSYLGAITALKYVISTNLWLKINRFLGICNIMDDFVGRKKMN